MAVFLDHVDSPLPTFTRISSRRVPEEILFIQQHMAIPPPPPPPPLVLAPIPNGGGVSPAVLGPVSNGRDVTSTSAPYSRHHDFVESELDLTLYKAMESLSTARVKTIRIVSGSDSLVQALLKYVVQRPDCVQKLWLEDVAPLVLRRFLVDQVDFWNDKACTGLTHFRLRKLKATGLRRLFHNLDTTQNNSIPMFLDLMLSRSPSLTSLALDHIQNLEMLPEILAPLTFPNLTAFQLRSQTEDSCPAPYFLTDKRLLNFLLRHPNIKAFGWPAESFVPYESEVPQLSPLLDQFSRRLVWFRSDCSLLDSTTQHQSRYIGPPQTSRNFVAHFLRRMEFLETIKLQGDYQVDELVAIIKAIEESDSSNKMLKFSLIRAHVEASVLTPIAKSMPNLRELKLCAYFTPGLVSMYDTAPQIAQEIDGGLVPNISLVNTTHLLKSPATD